MAKIKLLPIRREGNVFTGVCLFTVEGDPLWRKPSRTRGRPPLEPDPPHEGDPPPRETAGRNMGPDRRETPLLERTSDQTGSGITDPFLVLTTSGSHASYWNAFLFPWKLKMA